MNDPLATWPGLHIIAPPSRHSIPAATARCRCGHHRHARGQDAVRALIAAYTEHRATCDGTPENTTATTDRSAAA